MYHIFLENLITYVVKVRLQDALGSCSSKNKIQISNARASTVELHAVSDYKERFYKERRSNFGKI